MNIRIKFIFSILVSLALLVPVFIRTSAASISVTPTLKTDYISNPGIGWQYMDSSDTSILPETVAYPDRSEISWKVLNPSEGVYNWGVLDGKISAAQAQGKQISFRIYTMRGEEFGGHQVPQWVLDNGAKILASGSPDYLNCTYQEEWASFVEKLANRYDGNQDIAYIDISGYGNFNEWSWTDGLTEWEDDWGSAYSDYVSGEGSIPAKDLFVTLDGQARRRLVDVFAGGSFTTHQCRNSSGATQTVNYTYTGFEETQLIMPIAGIRQSTQYVHVYYPEIGFRHDCLGRSGSEASEYEEKYGEFYGDVWKEAPIVYELCAIDWDDANFVNRAEGLLQYSHGSLVHDNPDGPENASVMIDLMKYVGYRYYLESATIPSPVQKDEAFNIVMNWKNLGYTKNYPSMGQDFRLQFSLLDSDKHEVFTTTSVANIENWLPADELPGTAPDNNVTQSVTIPGTVPAGDYTLAVNLIDLRTSKPINLAMEGRVDGTSETDESTTFYELTLISVQGTDTPLPGEEDGIPVYRFFNKLNGAHLYTISTIERDAVKKLTNEWVYEGEKFKVFDEQIEGTVPVYRFFNTQNGAHLYTISDTEATTVIKNLPHFNYEGIKFFVYPTEQNETLAVFRFFNTENGAHLYTTSEHEKDTVMEIDKFLYEGTKYFVK